MWNSNSINFNPTLNQNVYSVLPWRHPSSIWLYAMHLFIFTNTDTNPLLTFLRMRHVKGVKKVVIIWISKRTLSYEIPCLHTLLTPQTFKNSLITVIGKSMKSFFLQTLLTLQTFTNSLGICDEKTTCDTYQ